MHCPECGCHVFKVTMDFSKTDNNMLQELISDDYVTCTSCDKEFLMGELIPDNPVNIPDPGTREAIAMGCTCPVEDNNHGKGYTLGPEGEVLFIYSGDCPIHQFGKEKP